MLNDKRYTFMIQHAIPFLFTSDRSFKQHYIQRTEKVQEVFRIQQRHSRIPQHLIYPPDNLCRRVYTLHVQSREILEPDF